MHGTPRGILCAQAEALKLPLLTIDQPWPASNAVYERSFRATLDQVAAEGVTHIAFGDLFLADVRRYRERLLEGTGVEPLFPLWGRVTADLANEMIAGGLCARVTTVDLAKLGAEWLGANFDEAFLGALPEGIDPCGEHGEFHTVVYNMPGFGSELELEGRTDLPRLSCQDQDQDQDRGQSQGQAERDSVEGFAYWWPRLTV